MRVEDMTDKQIHWAIAVAQGWVLESGRWVDESKTYTQDGKLRYKSLWKYGTFYTPTTNIAQAFTLLEDYRLQVMFQEGVNTWLVESPDILICGVDKSLPRAICTAVINIVFGEDVDHSVVVDMAADLINRLTKGDIE